MPKANRVLGHTQRESLHETDVLAVSLALPTLLRLPVPTVLKLCKLSRSMLNSMKELMGNRCCLSDRPGVGDIGAQNDHRISIVIDVIISSNTQVIRHVWSCTTQIYVKIHAINRSIHPPLLDLYIPSLLKQRQNICQNGRLSHSLPQCKAKCSENSTRSIGVSKASICSKSLLSLGNNAVPSVASHSKYTSCDKARVLRVLSQSTTTSRFQSAQQIFNKSQRNPPNVCCTNVYNRCLVLLDLYTWLFVFLDMKSP